ncbi:hypothetical protein [Candidatus Deferrimicrobium sp.]|uniref:hypothetical protein n=1 Tax=Candidatus Deferrimicrobium sp. TaxID=3060586 RepID=UPI002ED90937
MEMDDFDVYPISHNGRVYNIITAMDLTFREVRGMIDELSGMGAFPTGPGAHEDGDLFTCAVEGFVFEVDVQGFDVVVYRRGARR